MFKVKTLSGTTAWATTSKGTAFDFDGSSEFKYTDPGIPVSTGYTISAWARFDTASTVTSNVTGADGGTGARNFQFKRDGSTGAVKLITFDSAGAATVAANGSTTLNSGVWYHLVGTYDSTSGSVVYVNGSQDGSDASTHSTMFTLDDAADELYIGHHGRGNSDRHDGYIQNVRLYDRALSATEVSRLYSEPWAGLEPLSPFSFFSGLSQIYAYYSAAFLQRLG